MLLPAQGYCWKLPDRSAAAAAEHAFKLVEIVSPTSEALPCVHSPACGSISMGSGCRRGTLSLSCWPVIIIGGMRPQFVSLHHRRSSLFTGTQYPVRLFQEIVQRED